MQRVLFHETIFGPIHSRRLGTSLGVNLSPTDGKTCTFDCIYCEAGYNAQGTGSTGLPSKEKTLAELEEKLAGMKARGERLDVITFSGNGEPTIHPDFPAIIEGVIALRNKYFPDVKISVLSNSTMLRKPEVFEVLKKIDNNILKLDSAFQETVDLLDRPVKGVEPIDIIAGHLTDYGGNCIVQTMITAGEHDGRAIDNSTEQELDGLIGMYKKIRPKEVMLYTVDRPTPEKSLRHISRERLEEMAAKITRETGIPVQVSA